MAGNRPRLEVENIGDVTVVNFTDKKILEEATIHAIGDELFGLADQLGPRKMLLNFSNVEYLSSAALGKLIVLNKKVCNVGGQLALCNIDPQIYEVFEITKLNKLFRLERRADNDDSDGNCGGVSARLKPPKPSGGGHVALKPPPPEWDE
jgi:anti-sigma B factor antagonist